MLHTLVHTLLVLQMVNPRTNHRQESCIALYLPLVRGYLTNFFTAHKEEDLKKAVVELGGSFNQRAFFLKSTSQDKRISRANGVTRASVVFIPRIELDDNILQCFDSGKHQTVCTSYNIKYLPMSLSLAIRIPHLQ